MKNSIKNEIKSIFSKDNDKESVMHSKSDTIWVIINVKADEIIELLFESVLNRYQIGLEASVTGSDLIFDCLHLLNHKCHKIKF